jgi:hypothetical protein
MLANSKCKCKQKRGKEKKQVLLPGGVAARRKGGTNCNTVKSIGLWTC